MQQATAGVPPPSARSRRLVLTVMCAGYFLVLLDVTIINVALPQIGAGLGADVAGLQWVVDGYALTLASLLLVGGTVGDLRGHKRVVLAGLALFGVASLGCGLAPSIGALIAARAVQGVGAALLLPGTLAIITGAFPKRGEQARAIGIWAGVGSVALPAGPLLGGVLVSALGWRAVFFVNVPIVLVAGVFAARLVRESVEPSSRRVDAAGVLLAGLFLATVTYAFIALGHGGLGDAAVGSGIAALLLLASFLLVERSPQDPMLPLHLFARPAFSTANAVAGAMNLGTLGLLFLLTLYLQMVQHRTALAAGVALLPLFLPLSLLAPVAGRFTAQHGPKLPMAVGLLFAAVGVGLLARLQPGSGYLGALLPAMLAWGIGLGVLTPAVVAAAVGAVEPDRAGLASGVNNTARQAGGAIGIAAFGALAGQPGGPGFLGGLHVAGLLTAGIFLASAAATGLLIPVGQQAT